MVKPKSPATILSEAVAGRRSLDRESLEMDRQNLKPLTKKFGTCIIRDSIYPDPKCRESMTGTRWTAEFQSGPIMSIVISDNGQVIERTYTDHGDVHFDDVIQMLRGWQKAIKQAYRGGRPKGSGKPKHDYDAILTQLAKSGLSEREFEHETGISRSTIRRAKENKRRKDSRNR
jgi:hypothetical protein